MTPDEEHEVEMLKLDIANLEQTLYVCCQKECHKCAFSHPLDQPFDDNSIHCQFRKVYRGTRL